MKPLLKQNPLLKIVNSMLVDLPCPSNITYFWNMGSILGLCLAVQLISGVFLSMHYAGDTSLAFNSISHIARDVNLGWLIRIVHANGASLFFISLYIHTARGLYYHSFYFTHTWMVGVSILLATMATAFMGYVLPWGQMSFWGATVITNLFSAIPFIGTDIVTWLWGGFAVDNATLNRFFSFHFLLPFIISALVMVHLFFLHSSGSSNPLGTQLNLDKVPFHPYYTYKDFLGFTIILILFLLICFFYPWLLGDPENFIPANPLVTPVHIQPEWYFLFAYAILRSIPNKLGGVVALAASVLILYALPFIPTSNNKGVSFLLMKKFLFWNFVAVVILLSWIGARPVEAPFIVTGQILTTTYFLYFIMITII